MSTPRSLRLAAGFALALSLAACQTVPPAPPTQDKGPVGAPPTKPQFTRASFADLPGFDDDDLAQAWPAFLASCRALVARPAARATWQPPCTAANAVDGRDPGAVRAFFVANFSPWRVAAADGTDTGLVTGYYEPLLRGSRTRSAAFGVPLYAPPDDLLTVDLGSLYPELKDKRVRGRLDGKRVVPYWPRADFEKNAGSYADKALVYVDDPVEAFFLEIQGSGRVALDDGTMVRLNYADQNGHPYKSVARVLIDRGELTYERSSMQAISAWAKANPERVRSLLDENPSYVFFREVPPARPGTLDATIDGPQGALGVPLLAGRAIAVDPRAIPLGAPVFLATTEPLSSRPLHRLVLAQDTGGAIRGAVRADFFWGFGPDAARSAGRMKQEGRMWLLWPKGSAPPA
ncbi:MAG: murein transglycosylase A [Burkholderiales bacterium]